MRIQHCIIAYDIYFEYNTYFVVINQICVTFAVMLCPVNAEKF